MTLSDLLSIIWRFLIQKRIFTWIRWGCLIIAATILLLTFIKECPSVTKTIKIFTSIILFLQIVVTFSDNKLQDEIFNLDARLLKIKNVENSLDLIFNAWLQFIIEHLMLDASWRVSLYIFDDRGKEENDRFRFVARYSKDPQLKRKGRTEFKVDQGIIGEAWKNKFCYKYFKKGIIDDQYVKELVSIYKFSLNEAKALKMKSRSILGSVILNNNSDKVGIIILESMNYLNKCNQKEMNKKFSDTIMIVSLYLSTLLEIYSDNILNQEQLEGFFDDRK